MKQFHKSGDHAIILHRQGVDHERLTLPWQDSALIDIHSKMVKRLPKDAALLGGLWLLASLHKGLEEPLLGRAFRHSFRVPLNTD